MSLKTGFTFTNVEANDSNVTVYNIEPADYAQLKDEPNMYKMSNTTAGVDTPEIITYQCGKLTKVPLSEEMKSNFPSPSIGGIQYGVKVEELLRVQREDDTVVHDLPVSVCITFKHARTASITESDLMQVLGRALGALFKADGSNRLADMMRFCIKPR